MNLSSSFTAVPVIQQSDLSPFKTKELQEESTFPIYCEEAKIQ